MTLSILRRILPDDFSLPVSFTSRNGFCAWFGPRGPGRLLYLCVCILISILQMADSEELAQNTETMDPHFRKTMCKTCHPNNRPDKMTYDQIDDLCHSCHQLEANRTEIHPSKIASHRGAVQKVPSDFPLHKGKLTCLTCHDVNIQCNGPGEHKMNPLFLRGGPYENSEDICYRCHDPVLYDVFAPHDQRNEQGRIKREVCLYCHKPTDQSDLSVKDIGQPFVDICKSCHRMGAHPTGIDHMRKPSRQMQAYIRGVAKRKRLYIPLNVRNEIYCSTCHNPHEAGIFSEEDVKSLGAEGDKPKSHRIRISADQICTMCHDKNKYHGNTRLYR